MLAAAGDALSLSSPGVAGGTPDHDLVLAQTGQVPDAGQLRDRAAKAMDKDDKKKMGDEKFNQYKKIRKILQQKNRDSQKLA